jgi:molecular chaperone Hsp33
MIDRDCLHKFVFEHLPFRGQLVHLDAAWKALLEHRNYPDVIRDTVGEAVAASVLLAATLKFEGHLALQLQGEGPMRLLLAHCTSSLGVRALARYDAAQLPMDQSSRDFSQLVGAGNLLVTLDNDSGVDASRYQGVVSLQYEHMAACLESYFTQSEQLPTRLWLHADENGASGMLLQRLPVSADQAVAAAQADIDIEDAWHRVQLIGDTLKPEELSQLSDREILRRLFNEDDVRLFEPAPVFFRCTCSRERVIGMLQSLGRDEVQSIVDERGSVEVNCDFCNRAYLFDVIDATRLFSENLMRSDGTVH